MMVSRTAIESYFENKNNFSPLIDTPYFDILERLRVENMCLLSVIYVVECFYQGDS